MKEMNKDRKEHQGPSNPGLWVTPVLTDGEKSSEKSMKDGQWG